MLGLQRVQLDQAGDAVQAVEQEVRANPRLQRFQARLQLGLLLPAPLALQVKVAQHQGGHDQRDQRVPQIQIDLAGTRQFSAQLIVLGDRRAAQGEGHHQQAAGTPRQRHRQACEQWPQAAEQRRREQYDPLHEQRRQGQAHPVEARRHRLRQHQHEHQQLRQQHQGEQGFGFAELGNEEVVLDGRPGRAAGLESDRHRQSFRKARGARKTAAGVRAK